MKCSRDFEDKIRKVVSWVLGLLLSIGYSLGWVYLPGLFVVVHFSVGLAALGALLMVWLVGDFSFCKELPK